ncbi:ribonuclease HII [Candidatus Saccharibacteria bacterium]|nr:ribonuclease HII [Candidatus Saccharibacteria bacterium]
MIGIDEVGRGCWAGPLLVVAAVAHSSLPEGLADSKVLSKSSRESLFDGIRSSCCIGEGWVQPEEIDTHGLTASMKIAVSRALVQLGAKFGDEIIMDGNINYCPTDYTNVQTIIRADSLHPIVSAASIYAKVLRDRHMQRLARFYPYYGFEKHVGYGTQLHKSALKVHGPSSIHRKSFKPIQELV